MPHRVTNAFRSIAFLLTIACFAIAVPAEDAPKPAATPESSVETSGGLSSAYVKVGSEVDFWVRVKNPGATPMDGVRIALLDRWGVYSIDPVKACWSGSPDVKLARISATECGTVTIPAHGELALGGSLVAGGPANAETLGAVVRWNPPSSESEWVSLGTLSSDAQPTYWLETNTVLLSFFGAIAVGALAFSGKAIFDYTRGKKEALRTQQSETWNQLLEQMSDFSLKYYLPAWGSLQWFLEDVRAYFDNVKQKGASDPQSIRRVRNAFFHWATFEYRMRLITRCVGGFQFKNYVGETVVQTAYYSYRGLFYDIDEKSGGIVEALMLKMRSRETQVPFLDASTGSTPEPAHAAAWTLFSSWVQTSEAAKAITYLTALDPIFGYETNRPFYHWYGWMDPVALTPEQIRTIESLWGSARRAQIKLYIWDLKKGRQRNAYPRFALLGAGSVCVWQSLGEKFRRPEASAAP